MIPSLNQIHSLDTRKSKDITFSKNMWGIPERRPVIIHQFSLWKIQQGVLYFLDMASRLAVMCFFRERKKHLVLGAVEEFRNQTTFHEKMSAH